MARMTDESISKAKAASRAAVEDMMLRWGFDPAHTGLWDHMVNNASHSLALDLAQLSGDDSRIRRDIAAPQSDLSFLAPELAQRIGAAYQGTYPNEERVEAAIKPLIQNTEFKTAYALMDAMHHTLMRASARAALTELSRANHVERA